ncbi:hypothetical protein CBP36_19500 (plasmid) [Acidovorax carolinensis]|uniref:Uncharacterized protein n=1 Tax=Acidovorax carolinensis TaxID=553814 RepID=A0A240UJ61_9BURK|nr:hypothetical protein [Acidovorax carolinensis]ART61155.1 hypothetical protein CBP36_19500 [Acidovorax carolinensis]
MSDELELWTVYDSPIDLPGRFVARKWLLDQPTNELLQDKTLEGLRAKLPQGLTRLERSPQDDPKIVETWI